MKFQSQSPPNIITHQLLLSWYPGFIISWSPDLLKYCYPEILFSWTPYNSSLSWPPSSYKSSPCCRKGILISFLAPWSLVTGEVPWPGQAWPWPGLAWPWRGLAWRGLAPAAGDSLLHHAFLPFYPLLVDLLIVSVINRSLQWSVFIPPAFRDFFLYFCMNVNVSKLSIFPGTRVN